MREEVGLAPSTSQTSIVDLMVETPHVMWGRILCSPLNPVLDQLLCFLHFSHSQETPATAPSPTLTLSSTLQWCPSTCPSEWLSSSMPGFTWCWDRGDGSGSSLDRTVSASVSDPASPNRWASWSSRRKTQPPGLCPAVHAFACYAHQGHTSATF